MFNYYKEGLGRVYKLIITIHTTQEAVYIPFFEISRSISYIEPDFRTSQVKFRSWFINIKYINEYIVGISITLSTKYGDITSAFLCLSVY